MNMKKLRKEVFRMCYENKNPHLPSSLSILPIIEKIYKNFDFKKDVFVLSKGHGCAGLFAFLKMKYGFKFDEKQRCSFINEKNGISCTTGSLGHGLPLACGMALAKKIKGEKGKVYVLIGDQEYYEGTTFECLHIKDNFNLTNLKIHLDLSEVERFKQMRYDMVIQKSIKEFPHSTILTEEEYKEYIK